MKWKQQKSNEQKFLLGFWLECIEFIDQFEERQHTDYIETLIYKNILSPYLETFIFQ